MGIIITIISVMYVGYIWYTNWQKITQQSFLLDNLFWIFLSLLFYLGISYFLPLGWITILKTFGVRITFNDSMAIYGKSQIAKYVPGNIFHFLGRHMLSKKYNIENGIIINGIFLEIATQAFVSILIGLFASLFLKISNISFLKPTYYIIIFSTLFILLITFAILFKFFKPFKVWVIKNKLIVPLKDLKPGYIISHYLLVFIIYFFYTILNGIVFWFLSYNFWGYSFDLIFIIIGAYTISWLIGFITPGAPGGLGVREAVLILILTPYISGARALILALLFRLITILADLLFFLTSFIFQHFGKLKKKSLEEGDS